MGGRHGPLLRGTNYGCLSRCQNHNPKLGCCVLFGRHTEDLSPEDSLLDREFPGGKGGARI